MNDTNNTNKTNNISENYFKIWVVGFYEGEGSVSNDKSNNNRLRLSISQNDITPLLKCQKIWGGNITKRVRNSPASNKICTSYEWRISHNNSLKFINDIQPYMIIPYKINQIKQVMERYKQGNNEIYKCNFCEKTYKNPSGRRRHELSIHINKGEFHKCSSCDETFINMSNLKKHISLKHKKSNASVVRCEIPYNVRETP